MNSGLWQLNSKDFRRAIANAVATAVIVALYKVVTTPGFDLWALDYLGIGKLIVNSVFIVVIGSLGGALGVDSHGKLLGRL